MELQAGLRIDRYVLSEPLGEGGQGAVWKATDPLAPDEPCALKLVPVVAGRPNDLERARREARALAELSHPSIVSATALFEDLKLGVLGIAMELVRGKSLKQLAREGRLDEEEKSLVLEHVVRALDYLHRSGVVHRDVKLDNVVVRDSFWDDPTRPEGVKVVDLGIAAVAGADRDLTQEGTVVGTLSYLAPELLDPATFDGGESAPAVDVFAFGVMGWLLLTGEHPSGLPAGSKAVEYTRTYRKHAAPGAHFPQRGTIAEPALERRWQPVLERCLELDSKARFHDGSALADALEMRSPESVVVRPSRRGGGGEPTAVATPNAMVDATVLAEQSATGAVAGAATVELGPSRPPKAKKSSPVVLPLVTLLVAVVIGTAVAFYLVGSPSQAVGPSKSARPRPAHPSPVARPSASSTPSAELDAEASPSAELDASAEVPAIEAPCAHGCRSGRSCGVDGCEAALSPEDVYTLRLGGVETDAAGNSLFSTYRTAEVCISLSGSGRAPTCMPLAETLDGGVTRAALSGVGYADLVGTGLDVLVRNSVPGQGTAELASKKGVKLPDSARRSILCSGLVIDGLSVTRDVAIERVVLYLDDPAGQPSRCP